MGLKEHWTGQSGRMILITIPATPDDGKRPRIIINIMPICHGSLGLPIKEGLYIIQILCRRHPF